MGSITRKFANNFTTGGVFTPSAITNTSLNNITDVPAAAKGKLTLISTQTASSDASISFTSGIDSTYHTYIFKFINIHPGTGNVIFKVNFRDGGSNYDATKTTTWTNAYQNENGGSAGYSYATGGDLAQSTAGQYLGWSMYADNDQSASGYLHLFNPSSTTFVKHFIARVNNYYTTGSADAMVAGYCNTTTAIDGVQFSMSSGNIDAGTISMYGLGA